MVDCSKSVMAWSFVNGMRVVLEKQHGEVEEAIGEECFSICSELVDAVIVVDDEALTEARQVKLISTYLC